MTEYNYESFPLTMSNDDFEGFPHGLKAGQKAPDGELVDAATGERVKLSDHWADGPVMIEFGSVT